MIEETKNDARSLNPEKISDDLLAIQRPQFAIISIFSGVLPPIFLLFQTSFLHYLIDSPSEIEFASGHDFKNA